MNAPQIEKWVNWDRPHARHTWEYAPSSVFIYYLQKQEPITDKSVGILWRHTLEL